MRSNRAIRAVRHGGPRRFHRGQEKQGEQLARPLALRDMMIQGDR